MSRLMASLMLVTALEACDCGDKPASTPSDPKPVVVAPNPKPEPDPVPVPIMAQPALDSGTAETSDAGAEDDAGIPEEQPRERRPPIKPMPGLNRRRHHGGGF